MDALKALIANVRFHSGKRRSASFSNQRFLSKIFEQAYSPLIVHDFGLHVVAWFALTAVASFGLAPANGVPAKTVRSGAPSSRRL
jgi:hypothetical protein